MTQTRTSTSTRRLTFSLFFFSGASALAYEITWVRELSLSFGVSIYAVTAVLTAFMAGLALGSWIFARVAWSQPPLRLYAALQLGIAVTALMAPFVFGWLTGLYVWLYNQLTPSFYLFNVIRFGLAAVFLLVPTTLMGGSFPVISRYIARREGSRGGDLGFLYAANTLGGVVGTCLTGLLLIRILGVQGTILLAAAVDGVVALIAWLASRRDADPAVSSTLGSAGTTPPHSLPPVEKRARGKAKRGERRVTQATRQLVEAPAVDRVATWGREARFVWWAFALSGFAALGYEVVWTRLLAIFVMNAIFSFTIMLTTFLVGLSIGSLIMARFVDRMRYPLHTFGYLQLLIGLTSILMLFVFAKLYTILGALTSRVTFGTTVAAEFTAASFTMLLPTLLIGATFPIAARVYANGSEEVGKRIGRLYAINTVGAMLGSLVAGFLLIPLAGLQRASLVLAMLNLGLGAMALLMGPHKPRWEAGGVIAAAALAAILLPPGIYLGFREGTSPNLVFYKEGIDATVSVFEVKEPPVKVSFVNGRSEVPTDKHSMRAFYLLGHLPPLLRPDAQSALMISFGNGIATGAMARHNIPQIQSVEIVAEQVEAAELYRTENRNVLDYPGLEITIEDGRNYLLRSREQFDIITADATHPVNSSSWALFTREFYSLARRRLAEDGVMVQWLPFHDLSQSDYRQIIKTFQSVFPHTTLWFTGGTHTFLVATPEPLSREEILELGPHIEAAGIADDLVSAERLQADFLMEEDEVRAYVGDAGIVTDDNAFFVPARNMQQIVDSFMPYLEAAAR